MSESKPSSDIRLVLYQNTYIFGLVVALNDGEQRFIKLQKSFKLWNTHIIIDSDKTIVYIVLGYEKCPC